MGSRESYKSRLVYDLGWSFLPISPPPIHRLDLRRSGLKTVLSCIVEHNCLTVLIDNIRSFDYNYCDILTSSVRKHPTLISDPPTAMTSLPCQSSAIRNCQPTQSSGPVYPNLSNHVVPSGNVASRVRFLESHSIAPSVSKLLSSSVIIPLLIGHIVCTSLLHSNLWSVAGGFWPSHNQSIRKACAKEWRSG